MNKLYLEISFQDGGINILKKIPYIRTVSPVFFQRTTSSRVVLGYGGKSESEYLHISINLISKEVVVERDLKSTLVLYYRFVNNLLIITSEISDFGSEMTSEKINMNHVLYFLSQGMSTSSTLIKDVNVMYPERRYVFKSNEVVIEEILQYYKNFEDINEIPSNIFKNYNSSNIAFEISGGKDSSFFPFLCKYSKFGDRVNKAFGIKLEGVAGKVQWETINGICNYLELESHYYNMKKTDAPFLNMNYYLSPFDLREENYLNSFLGEIEILKKYNVDTIFNGIGGDEMFMMPIPFEKKVDSTKIFNEKYREDIAQSDFKHAVSTSFANSIYDANISRNAIFTRNGIWQVSPFHDRGVYNFFRSISTSKVYFYDYFYNAFGQEIASLFDNNQNFNQYFWEYTKTEFFMNYILKLKDLDLINQYLNWEEILHVMNDNEMNEENLMLRYKIFLCLKLYFSVSFLL